MTVCNWAEVEMEKLDTGDLRLDKRAKRVLKAIGDKPNSSFTQQFQSAAELKSCYRLFDSELINSETILEPHFAQTVERIKMSKLVIIASDSSSLNYTTRMSNPDSGYISSNNAQEFLMHASVATTLNREPLGIVSAKFWARCKQKSEKKVHRDYLPITDKESYKWIESYVVANRIAQECPNTQIVNVADREADVMELWEEAIKSLKLGHAAHLVIRCNHNRAVLPNQENQNTKLFEFGKDCPLIGSCEFELKNRATHSVIRKVRQNVRASSVCIYPAYRPGIERKQLVLNLVLMEEINPPEGDKPILWYLLTTLPIQTNEDIEKIIQSYLARWDIETIFRTFKTGCKVEERSLRTADRLYPMFSLFLIVAWRINHLSRVSRIHPDEPCTIIFSEQEWKAAYIALHKSRPPTIVPTLREILITIARLGGYLNRNSDPEPGAKVIWRGLGYLRVFMEAWEISQVLNSQNEFSVKKSCG